MKKSVKKFLSVFMAIIMVALSGVTSFAMDESEWATVFESADAKAGLTVFVGSDESERNFTWYTEKENTPYVAVSADALFADAEKFTGTTEKASDGDYVNHVTVTGLEYNTTYYYKATSGAYESEVYSFTTASEKEFKAVYMTDIHISADSEENPDSIFNNSLNLNNALEDAFARENDISVLLSAGDQASDGLECEYKGFSVSPWLKTISVATSIGNHDRKGVEYKTYTNLPNEYEEAKISSYIGDNYWFVKGDVLFLCVDTNNASGEDHAAFVHKAVNANPDVKWKVLMAHHDLYSGRIPHRESENALIRMMWAPIVDEYGIDLVLLGHSHFYTVSNVLYNNKTVAPLAAEMIDPAGALYMVSCSINRPREEEELGLNEDVIGFDYLTLEPTYNILTCSEDSITVESYEVGAEDAFNSFTITKTTKDGGHEYKENAILTMFNNLVRKIGTIYALFNNIGRYSDLTEDGFDVDFFACVFGK